jgi:hypothetical protein
VPFTQAERAAKYRPYRSRPRGQAGIREPDPLEWHPTHDLLRLWYGRDLFSSMTK